MRFARKKRQNQGREFDNRLHLILAIIFLFVGAVIFRLFNLQVSQYDLYVALASDQHQVFNKLEAERGKIFIQDGHNESASKLYPMATNKDFALVYVVPKKVTDSEKASEQLYEILDKEKTEKEVDEMLASDKFFSDNGIDESVLPDKEKEDFKKIKRELEIELRKKKIIEDLKAKLSKKDDPYEPIRSKVDEKLLEKLKAANLAGIDYIMESHRYYPEANIGAHFLGFVGFDGEKKIGQYGLEGFFNEELSGKTGSIKAERAAGGGLIIINDREYEKAQNGADLVLTVNRSIQFEACNRLEESALQHGADSGSIIVMEPNTGAILAMCSWPDYDPNNYGDIKGINVYNNSAIFEDYEPGSIIKVLTMAAGIDQGKVKPESTYEDKGFLMIEGWPKPIKNSDYESFGAHGVVDMVTVLESSLNTGAIHVMLKVGPQIFSDYIKNFGLGEKTGIELETEGITNIVSLTNKRIRPVEAATASFGQGITATPLQLVTAFAAVANGGVLVKPYMVKEIIFPNGDKQVTQPKQIRRVISERTSLLVSGMMVSVVDNGHSKTAGVKGYYVGGKTGTAQAADKVRGGYSKDRTIHTFVGMAPVDDPKFVMLVKLDNPKDARFAESSSAPLFRKLAEFILNYYQVPKER